MTKGAKDLILSEGFDEKYGARPLKRTLIKLVENPISEMILNKEIQENDSINIKTLNGSLKIEVK